MLKHDRVHRLDGDLVVLPELHMLDFLFAKEVLPPSDDGLHIIFGDLVFGENVELLQQRMESVSVVKYVIHKMIVDVTYQMLVNILVELVLGAEAVRDVHWVDALVYKPPLRQHLFRLSHRDLVLVTVLLHLLSNSNML